MQLARKAADEGHGSVQTTRTIFVLVNVAVALLWIRFGVRLIQQWRLMKPDIRFATGILLVFFCLLWSTLIREKKGYLSLAMAFGILATVYRIVWVLM